MRLLSLVPLVLTLLLTLPQAAPACERHLEGHNASTSSNVSEGP